MLKNIEITNFKSVTSARLDFGKVNLFIGPNGAGKSNLLEAIGVLSAALSGAVAPRDLDYKGVRLSLPHLFKATFKNRDIPKTFRLIGNFTSVEYSVTLSAGEKSSELRFNTEKVSEDGNVLLGRGPHGAKLHEVGPQHAELKGTTLEINNERSVYQILKMFSQISARKRL